MSIRLVGQLARAGLVLALSGCSVLLPDVVKSAPGDDVPHETVDLGFGLEADFPSTWRVTKLIDEVDETPELNSPPGCIIRRGSGIENNGTIYGASFILVGDECDRPQADDVRRRPFPAFVRVDNVSDASEIEHFDAPLGPAVMFRTPGRLDGTFSRVVLIRFAQPVDKRFPVLAISAIELDGEPPADHLVRSTAMAIRKRDG